MAQITPQVSELLERALTLSTHERGQLIDRLVASLDEEAPEEGVEAAWDEEIKRRVDDIRSGRVKTIPGEQVLQELAERLRDVAGRSKNPAPDVQGEAEVGSASLTGSSLTR